MAELAKWSANGVCALRAAAFLEATDVRHDDVLAADLVSGPHGVLATTPVLRKASWRLYNWLIPGLYYMHIARTRYFDARVVQAVKGGTRQLVILAAGLDSRAHRLVGHPVRCFELDLPANSALKQARVSAVLADQASPVKYVASDLSRPGEALEALAEAGLDDAAPAVFTLEGVSMYLQREHLDEVLAALARRAGDTDLILDWFDTDIVQRQGWCARTRLHFRQMARSGEPYTLGLDVATVQAMAAQHGFVVLDAVEGADVDRQWCSTPTAPRKGVGFAGMAHLRRTCS